MNTPELITDRLILRRFSEDDIPYLYRILRDETVNRFLPWFPLKSLEETEEFFNKRYKAVYEMEEGYQWAIALKDDNIPIGYINVDTTDSHDLGYGLIKEYWNSGIVTEAGRSVIQCVKENEIPYITATHDVNNPASGVVMRKLGMTYQYTYKEQWQPKNFPVAFRLYLMNLDGKEERTYMKYWNLSEEHFIEASQLTF